MMRCPEYCDDTFNDRGDGFFFSSPPPSGLTGRANLEDKNYWVILCCALARLQQGDFSVFPHLLAAMARAEDGDYWNSCGLLWSFAAPYSALRTIERVFPASKLAGSPELTRLYCKILSHSMAPWAIDEVLKWYAATRDAEVRVLVAAYLSHVLDETSIIARGPRLKIAPEPPPPFEERYYDYAEYLDAVRTLRDKAVVGGTGRLDVPLLGGNPFSVIELARRIIKHAKEGEDSPLTNFERMAFEGATGISCKSFFAQTEHVPFRPLAAAAIAEDFLRGGASKTFTPGIRYFFGHPIPP